MCLLAGAIVSAANAGAQTTVTVDPGQAWIGYMNVFDLPVNGGGYVFGSSWGTADLNASFSGAVLTLTPNTSIDRDVPGDTFWWQSNTGVTLADAYKNMDASMYVQNDALAGQSVTFTGNVLLNSLVDPYTSIAFIKDFAPDYSSFTQTTVPLAPGIFTISLSTSLGDHIQYGFETIGPDARLADVASFGSAQITAVPEPSSIALSIFGGLGLLSLRRRQS